MPNTVVDVVVDVVYPTNPAKLYALMFDSEWFTNFLVENQGVKDLEFEDWESVPGGDENLKKRKFKYTKHLNNPIGPKEVLCLETEENAHRDEDDYIETRTTTETPGVPYGKSFHVVTNTHIAWAEDRSTGSVLNVTSEVVWTGWCPFKGTVESRALEGQKQYAREIEAALREYLASGGFKGDIPSRVPSPTPLKPAAPRRKSSKPVRRATTTFEELSRALPSEDEWEAMVARGQTEDATSPLREVDESRLVSNIHPIGGKERVWEKEGFGEQSDEADQAVRYANHRGRLWSQGVPILLVSCLLTLLFIRLFV